MDGWFAENLEFLDWFLQLRRRVGYFAGSQAVSFQPPPSWSDLVLDKSLVDMLFMVISCFCYQRCLNLLSVMTFLNITIDVIFAVVNYSQLSIYWSPRDCRLNFEISDIRYNHRPMWSSWHVPACTPCQVPIVWLWQISGTFQASSTNKLI